MTVDLEQSARSIFAAALEAADAEAAFARRVSARPGELGIGDRTIRLGAFDDVRIAAIGKAAHTMISAAGDAIERAAVPAHSLRGLAIANVEPEGRRLPWVEYLTGSHPIPDERSFRAGLRLLDFVRGSTRRTLALFLLSGGGSALAEWPADPRITPATLGAINDAMVRAALPIRAINAVRKRLSAIKGGRLALAAAPAAEVTLVLSDVPPDDWQTVASGPTVPDTTTEDEALAAFDAASLDRFVSRDALGATPEAAAFAPIDRIVEVLVDCRAVASAAEGRARVLAKAVTQIGCRDGALDAVVDEHLSALDALVRANPGRVCAVVSSGEVTLEVLGEGQGGRNTHTVLVALARARDRYPSLRSLVVLSAGTDGRDGPTDAAGAVASLTAFESGPDAGPYLERFDSYRYFDEIGGLLRTGPTGTNVRDVRVFLGTGGMLRE